MYNFVYNKVFSLVIVLACTVSLHAFEIRPFAEFMFPSSVTIKKEVKDVDLEKKWDTDFVIKGGAEFLFKAEFAPLRYGFGLAYKSAQKQDDQVATPASIPVWLSLAVGTFNQDNLFSPYIAGRFGFLAPLTGDGNWWERPLNFFGNFGIGVIFPYNFGLEVNYDYSSMLKSFESSDTRFRVFSGRIGIQLSWGLSLTHDRKYKSDEEKIEEKGIEPVKDTTTADSTESYTAPEMPYDSVESEDTSSVDSSVIDTFPVDTVPAEAAVDTASAQDSPQNATSDTTAVADTAAVAKTQATTKMATAKKTSKKKTKAKSKKTTKKSSKKKKSKRR